MIEDHLIIKGGVVYRRMNNLMLNYFMFNNLMFNNSWNKSKMKFENKKHRAGAGRREINHMYIREKCWNCSHLGMLIYQRFHRNVDLSSFHNDLHVNVAVVRFIRLDENYNKISKV